MHFLLQDAPFDRLLNPSFDQLVSAKSESDEIFEGHITFGTISSLNTSIVAKVFRKNNKILIVGGADMNQLMEQNEQLILLNREVNDLQRQLIKEKVVLENTLNQLHEANNKLNEVVATKDKFFSIIAHDLKNPFNTILGLSELLGHSSDSFTSGQIKTYAQNINQGADQAYRLLENLLRWARVQRGLLKPMFTRITVSALVNEVFELLKENAEAKKIDLILDLQFTGFVTTDREMLLTILRNLISNALKFTHTVGKVILTTQKEQDRIVFKVSDTGVGMTREVMDKIFRIDSDVTQKGTAQETGSGLGLILSKEFVQKLGGKITVQSTPDEGTIFRVFLPLPPYSR
jgi:signal transduction histidine kinase